MFAGIAADAAPSEAGHFQRVHFGTEGHGYTPQEYALRLQQRVAAADFEPDNYSLGGIVTALEQQFARLLGKPAAMFVTTGTLANQLAVRKLAGADRRVLVQAESHLYNDSGDGAQILSGLNLVPLAEGEATMPLDEIRRWADRSAGGRVETRIGAISIESPVRRCDHAMVDFEEMQRTCAWARENGIRTHLDGARLFNLPLHSGKSLHEHTALFDTVYVSLWKHFNAGTGAILAGETDFIEGLYHTRRMFGGALPSAWPQIALASDYADGYEAEYAKSWLAADAMIRELQSDGRYTVRKVVNGTSRFHLKAPPNAPEDLGERLRARGVVLPGGPPGSRDFAMQVNPTILRREPGELARLLTGALAR